MASALENLMKISKGGLKAEPPSQSEIDGLIRSAKRKRQDSTLTGLGEESRFDLLYNAAHALALAALRRHGYRSENRYLVFQALAHTVSFPPAKWRVSTAATTCGIWLNTRGISMLIRSSSKNWPL